MAKAPITDANTLVHVVTGLGGRVVPGQTFRFDLPLSEVKSVVPQIDALLGLGCRKISERTEEHPTVLNTTRTVCELELYRK
jgi:hypothetical protein